MFSYSFFVKSVKKRTTVSVSGFEPSFKSKLENFISLKNCVPEDVMGHVNGV